MQQANTCVNCGNTFTGNYCNNCGEKLVSDHDKSLSHFFEEAFHFVTHFDSRYFKSLWKVFSKPGLLAEEYSAGIKRKNFSPLSLFLVGVVVYLLFPALRGLNISFNDHLGQYRSIHFNFLVAWAEHKAAHHHTTLEELGNHFNEESAHLAKPLLFFIIPFCGFSLALLFRKKARFFLDHFTLSAELNTFFLYFNFLLVPLVSWLLSFVISIQSGHMLFINDAVLIPLYLVSFLLFCIIAFHRFYKINYIRAVTASLGYLFFQSLIVYFIYRMIVFSIIMLII